MIAPSSPSKMSQVRSDVPSPQTDMTQDSLSPPSNIQLLLWYGAVSVHLKAEEDFISYQKTCLWMFAATLRCWGTTYWIYSRFIVQLSSCKPVPLFIRYDKQQNGWLNMRLMMCWIGLMTAQTWATSKTVGVFWKTKCVRQIHHLYKCYMKKTGNSGFSIWPQRTSKNSVTACQNVSER